jgi:hypothetical protein
MENCDTKSVPLTCSGHLAAVVARAERGKAKRGNRAQGEEEEHNQSSHRCSVAGCCGPAREANVHPEKFGTQSF